MRKILAHAFVSVDGVMQAPGGASEDESGGFDLGGWSMSYASEKSRAAVMAMVGTPAEPRDLLLGRRTYDIFASHWPKAPADHPIGAAFNPAHKYVMTRGTGVLGWANSHAVGSIEALAQLKAGTGPDLVLWGSSTLYPQLFEARLIDRLQLLTLPLVLGKGKRLLERTAHPASMTLLSCDATPTGVVIAVYDLAG